MFLIICISVRAIDAISYISLINILVFQYGLKLISKSPFLMFLVECYLFCGPCFKYLIKLLFVDMNNG